MEFIFLGIYDYFQQHRVVFYGVFVTLFILFGVVTSRVTIEEDVSRFFPDDARAQKLSEVFQNSRFAEKLVVMVSLKDTVHEAQADSLIAYTNALVANLEQHAKSYIKKINYTVDDELALTMFNTLHENIPVFLDDHDYITLDSLTQPTALTGALNANYRQLISPSGMVLKNMIAKDPLGISMLAVKKLRDLQYDENYELYDNYIVTKDHRNLLLFIVPMYPPNDTGHNSELVAGIDAALSDTNNLHAAADAVYFGAAAVAAGNAIQLHSDTILTLSLMVILLIIFLFGFLRKKRAPLIILIPVLFGGLFALTCIYFIKGSVSVLALAAGSVILGIAVNYSLHFLAHLRYTSNVREVIRDLIHPMTIGSATTVLAFFCLQFANAGVLQDLGLFAGFSLIGAALCSLIFLPQFVQDNLFAGVQHNTWIDRLSGYKPESNKYLLLFIFILTPVFFYFAQQVKFNSDLNSLNYMSDKLLHAQDKLNTLNEFTAGSVFIVASGDNLEDALKHNETITPVLDELKKKGVIQKYTAVSDFIISDSLQQARIAKWNRYWSPEKKKAVTDLVRNEGEKLKFSPLLFQNFDSLISKRYHPADTSVLHAIRTNFFDDYITERGHSATVVTLAKVDASERQQLYQQLENYKHIQPLDKQILTHSFVDLVHADFNFIVTFTSLLVFFALLLAYGRIELTLITFIPMLITWVWILGIMALAGIEFNIVNVMISTFIFGLGDDFSIFIMDGLQQEYKTGKEGLPSIKASIFLSAITTISGLGVLIFAKHPALRSIASVSIIGIACVFVMSQTLEPFFFRWLISGPAARGHAPRRAWLTIKTFFPYAYFVLGSFIMAGVAFFTTRLWPFDKQKAKFLYHRMLARATGRIFFLSAMSVKTEMNGQSFDKPAIIIANHQSILDILATVSMTPKVLLVTNDWVWNSPIFGFVVKLAEYYPAEHIEENMDHMRDRLNEGFSILVFPEGTRSPDSKLKRFHKGAFYLAEQLHADILPLVIHGSGELIPKGEFYVDHGVMTLKLLPRISPDDKRFGDTYADRTKKISRYFKEEFNKLSEEKQAPAYFRRKLISTFLYKGPVLEWYLRIKLSLEDNYAPFETLIPKQASVLDLGCGYGFLCYMLQFTSEQRKITGVDYDEDKIATAQHGYSKTSQLNFIHADVTTYEISQTYDVIIIADVLHYLSPEKQQAVLHKSFAALNPGGRVIVREGNTDLKKKHAGTKLSEFFSVRLLRFNKSTSDLHFMSGQTIRDEALKYGLTTEIMGDPKLTSNVIFVMRKGT